MKAKNAYLFKNKIDGIQISFSGAEYSKRRIVKSFLAYNLTGQMPL